VSSPEPRPKNAPLTDEEVCRKFGVEPGTPAFEVAKRLSRNRPDRVICEVPELMCPHCTHGFTATYHDLGANDPANGDEVPCPRCGRTIYVEHMTDPEDEEDYDGTIYVTLNTHPGE
jgi:predicted Zn finger-like uncharacterized protein